jgi:spore coat polysaccharide biosynthesis protein SpsF
MLANDMWVHTVIGRMRGVVANASESSAAKVASRLASSRDPLRRTVAIIQARTGSSRLPGKVLMPLLGIPILTHIVERTRRAHLVDEVVVATTGLPSDDAIESLARTSGWALVRGSETDLLDRYLAAARAHAAEIVVRITSDCPLIDPELIDDVVRALTETAADYASNSLEPRTYPRGLDVEAMTRETLERAAIEDTNQARREHATPYIYRHPERFRLRGIANPVDLSDHRWTVDTPEDFALVRRIYDALGRDDFGWREALAVVEAHPEWSDINRHVRQKTVPGT